MTMTEWGNVHAPDPDELVDFMTDEGCANGPRPSGRGAPGPAA